MTNAAQGYRRDLAQGPRRDHLTTTTNDGKIELTEQELSRAAGGAGWNVAANRKL